MLWRMAGLLNNIISHAFLLKGNRENFCHMTLNNNSVLYVVANPHSLIISAVFLTRLTVLSLHHDGCLGTMHYHKTEKRSRRKKKNDWVYNTVKFDSPDSYSQKFPHHMFSSRCAMNSYTFEGS